MDHPAFIVYVKELPNYEKGQGQAYVLGDQLAKVVNNITKAGHRIFITTKPFKYPPIYHSFLYYAGYDLFTKREYTEDDDVLILQYYQKEYPYNQMAYIRNKFLSLYDLANEEWDEPIPEIHQSVFEPTPKLTPMKKE